MGRSDGGRALLPGQIVLACMAAVLLRAGAEQRNRQNRQARPEQAVQITSHWGDGDPVEVYYGEFLLAQWVLERAPWNAYHSGLGFVNNRTNEKVLFDYTPEDTSSVMNMVMPDVKMGKQWRALLFGEATFGFRDAAKTQFFVGWPESYTSFVRMGQLNGSVFKTYAAWVAAEFAPKHRSFQPIEIAMALPPNPNSSVKAKTLLRSRMCHDFVTDSLWVLYDNGVKMGASEPILRDHIIMYADNAQPVGALPNRGRVLRQWLRYLRLLALFLDKIKQQFTHARTALIINWRLGLPVFLHDGGGNYQVDLVPPFLNYCYLPLAMPPDVHDPMGAMKLCALGMEANITNGTVPFPWGPELSVEEHLDSDTTLSSLAAVVAASVLVPLLAGSRSTGDAAKKSQ